MAVTIYDIAQRTGYSPPTVSKALNNQPDIGKATRLKISAVAAEMGYVPNQGAKTLVTRKSWLIGVIFQEIDVNLGIEHPLFNGIMDSFKKRIEQEGYELIFIARNLGQRKMSYLDHCRYRGVDGVLILNSDSFDDEVLEVVGSDVPSVSANIVYEETTTVTCQNTEPSIEAVRFLFGLGHRRIAHIAGPLNAKASAGLERREGYFQGLKACGIPYDERLLYVAEHWTEPCGAEALYRFRQLADPPTAVFCSSDLLALGVYSAARTLGLELPRDLSVLSFDDNYVARYLNPGLTTYRQDRVVLGRISAEQLVRRINGQACEKRIQVPVQLIERGSCQRLVPASANSSTQ